MDPVITSIIDKHLASLIAMDINMIVGKVVPGMAASQHQKEEWNKWLPVASTVTTDEINAFEKKIGYPLPESYKTLLLYKHFYELHIGEAMFCENVTGRWQKGLNDMIFDGYPKDLIYDKGYIPFADYNDWGLLCFDTTRKTDGFEYNIVLWDHERPDDFKLLYNNFTEMMIAFDEEDGSAT